MIQFIGDRFVPLRMRPVIYETRDEPAARDLLASVLPELRDNTQKNKMREIKRGLIGRWIDDMSVFGIREKQEHC